MSESDMNAPRGYEDLELITSYLSGELDADKVEVVRRRLEEDPAFLDFAAPLLLAWSVPEDWQRKARPAGELERHWDEFTRRAGFVHQKRKARRRLYGLLALVAILSVPAVIAVRGPLQPALWRAGFRAMPATDSVALTDGSFVRLDSGARLAVHRGYDTDTARFVRLQGRARFNVVRTDPPRPFYIVAAGGVAHTAGAEFEVHALGDTLVVRGGPRGAHTGDSDGSEGIVYLSQSDLRVDNQQVFWGERAWVVRGQSVQKDMPDVGDRPAPVGGTAARPLPPKKPVPRQTIASLRGRTIDPRGDWSAVGQRMEFPGGVIAYLDPGTRAAVEQLPFGKNIFAIAVDGTALLLVPRDTTKPFDVPAYVQTRAGYVAAAAPLGLIVETRADTTLVHVLALTQSQRVRDVFRGNYMAELYPGDLRITPENRMQLFRGQSARQVRGRNPVRLP